MDILADSKEFKPMPKKKSIIIIFEEDNREPECFVKVSLHSYEKHIPVHRENEWTGLTFESFQEIIKNELQNDISADSKEIIIKNDSIDNILEHDNREPEYYEKLFEANLNSLI